MAYILIIAPNALEIANALTRLGHEVEACTTASDAHNRQIDINLAEERGVELYIFADYVPQGGDKHNPHAGEPRSASEILPYLRSISWWHNVNQLPPPPAITTNPIEGQPEVCVVKDFTLKNIIREVQTLLS